MMGGPFGGGKEPGRLRLDRTGGVGRPTKSLGCRVEDPEDSSLIDPKSSGLGFFEIGFWVLVIPFGMVVLACLLVWFAPRVGVVR